MAPWMLEATAADGTRLHGAGTARSGDCWKALAGALVGQGLLAARTKAVAGGRSVPVVVATDAGAALLRALALPSGRSRSKT